MPMLKSFELVVNLIPVSKKNHGQIIFVKGRPMLIPSPQYTKYEKEAIKQIKPYVTKDMPIEYPINMKCIFYMPTKRKCDLANMLECIDDVFVRAGVLADDNYSIVESHDGSRVMYDKEYPRTEVYITPIER